MALAQATCLERLGRKEEALQQKRAIFAESSALLGRTHPDVLLNGNNLSQSLVSNGHFAEARRHAREHLAVTRLAVGKNHRLAIDATSRLGEALCKDPERTYADAIELEALSVDTAEASRLTYGPRHPDTLKAYANVESSRALLARLSP